MDYHKLEKADYDSHEVEEARPNTPTPDEDAQGLQDQPQSRPCSFRGPRLIAIISLAMLLLYLNDLTTILSTDYTTSRPFPSVFKNSHNNKVPLEIHIMSKCPDALDCLENLVVPTMANVSSSKVDFRLSYIGKPTPDDDGVDCMHGAEECLGNILELCAASLYPDPKIHLGFALCLSRSYPDIPARELVYGCALEHGVEFDDLNDCASEDEGAKGMDLLRASVERSEELGVRKSCTVRLDGKVRCIRDGGKWSDCEDGSEPEDLVKDIEELYEESRARGILERLRGFRKGGCHSS